MKPSRALALLLFLVGLLLAPGYVDNIDSRLILRTSEQILDTGRFGLDDVKGTIAVTEADGFGLRDERGAYQMKFGPGMALLGVPFVALGRATLRPLGLTRPQADEAGASLAAPVWFALSGLLLFALARRRLSERAALGTALLAAFATYLVVYAKSAYLEAPLTTAVLAAFLAAVRVRDGGGRGAAIGLGFACVVVLWIKLAALALLVGLVPVVFLGRGTRPWRGIAWAAAVFVVGAALFLLSNWMRFGRPFETGYAGSIRFEHALLPGIGELLASPWGGMLPFSPVLVLAFPGLVDLGRRDVGLAAGIVLTTVAGLLLYGMWVSPLGGDVWGARYMLPICTLLALPAGFAAAAWWERGPMRRGTVAALAAFSVAVQVPPALVSYHEIYSLRAYWLDKPDPPEPQRLIARILVEKASSPDGAYDLSRLSLGEGRRLPGKVERGLDLWPVRVASDLPRREVAAWAAWWTVAAAACWVGLRLARRTAAGRPLPA